MRRLFRYLRRRARDEQGAALILVVVGLPAFVAFGIFVIDVGNWWVHKRHLQTQADAAALAGAREYRFPACSNQDIVEEAVDYSGGVLADPDANYGGFDGTPLNYNHQLAASARPTRPHAGAAHAGQHPRPVGRDHTHRSQERQQVGRRRPCKQQRRRSQGHAAGGPQAVRGDDARRQADRDGHRGPLLAAALPGRPRLRQLHRRPRAGRAAPADRRHRHAAAGGRGPESHARPRVAVRRGHAAAARRRGARAARPRGRAADLRQQRRRRRHADDHRPRSRDARRPRRHEAADRREGRVQRQRLDRLRRRRRLVLRDGCRRRHADPRRARVRGAARSRRPEPVHGRDRQRRGRADRRRYRRRPGLPRRAPRRGGDRQGRGRVREQRVRPARQRLLLDHVRRGEARGRPAGAPGDGGDHQPRDHQRHPASTRISRTATAPAPSRCTGSTPTSAGRRRAPHACRSSWARARAGSTSSGRSAGTTPRSTWAAPLPRRA